MRQAPRLTHPLLSVLLIGTVLTTAPSASFAQSHHPDLTGVTEFRLPPLSDRLSGFRADRFRADHASLSARIEIGTGAEGGLSAARAAQSPDLILSFAALYLSHGFWAEARSTLSELDPERLTPQTRSEHARLSLLAIILDPSGQKPDPSGLLPETSEVWADSDLFAALSREAPDPQTLGEAARFLGPLPVPIRQRAVPLLLEAALDARAWDLARLFGAEMQATPGLGGSTADLFLQGLGAERVGMREDALLAYERAGSGSDLWAQRARIAWANLALSSGLRETDLVRDQLSRNRFAWRGGASEFEGLRLLFGLIRDAGDPLGALDLLTDIRDRHPERADEVASEGERWGLVERFYRMGETGEIPFGALFDGHRRLFAGLSSDPRLLDLTEIFAERLYRSGAYRLAAEEYRRVHEAMRAQASIGRAPIPARRDRVRLRLAEILLDVGLPEEAAPLLSNPTLDPDLSDLMEPLRARLYTMSGDHEAVLNTWVPNPDPGHRLLLARAHMGTGGWDAARDHLALILDTDLNSGVGADFARASFRAGTFLEDADLIRRARIPERLAEPLLNADAAPTRLSRSEVEGRLAEVGRVLEEAERILEPEAPLSD
jgi:hypothetical protein